MFKVNLGSKVKSVVTGITGIVTNRSECLYGCNRYFIQPKADKTGKFTDGIWVDEGEVKVIEDTVVKGVQSSRGGPASRIR